MGGKAHAVMMHDAIYGPVPDGKMVDHRSKDSLDNRRSNLRDATKGENMWNSGKRRNNTSGYKGVTWSK